MNDSTDSDPAGGSGVAFVERYLRAQNLEQLGRVDEAIELYEVAVAGGFDSIGPYDRLVHLYGRRARHRDVIRVATRAIAQVHTHEAKKAWYERVLRDAERALERVPQAAPKRAPGPRLEPPREAP